MATAIILAAGFSRRFGQNKLLADFKHKPLVKHVIDRVANLHFENSILVYREANVKKLAPQTMHCIYNPNSSEGLSSSVKCGVIHSGETDAFVFFMGDQPFVDEDTVHQMLSAFHDGKGSIIVPLYDGYRGNPVLFSAKWKNALTQLTGDSGGRSLIEANPGEVFFVKARDSGTGGDIDTWEQFLRFQAEDRE